jgi:hypothetical protein
VPTADCGKTAQRGPPAAPRAPAPKARPHPSGAGSRARQAHSPITTPPSPHCTRRHAGQHHDQPCRDPSPYRPPLQTAQLPEVHFGMTASLPSPPPRRSSWEVPRVGIEERATDVIGGATLSAVMGDPKIARSFRGGSQFLATLLERPSFPVRAGTVSRPRRRACGRSGASVPSRAHTYVRRGSVRSWDEA